MLKMAQRVWRRDLFDRFLVVSNEKINKNLPPKSGDFLCFIDLIKKIKIK